MRICGVEIYAWMVKHARDYALTNYNSQSLEFHTYNKSGELPYKAKSFDLVYSKGVLNHVADKDALFRQVNEVLKPNGLFIIADWIFPQAVFDGTLPLVCETKESYEQALRNAGFDDIIFRNDSEIFLSYAEMLLKNLSEKRELIESTYNKNLFLLIKTEHEELIEKISNKQKYAVRILAKKA